MPRDASRWEDAARILLIVATLGSFTSPPVANIGAFLALVALGVALWRVPATRARLALALGAPLVRGILVLLATLAVAMLWAQDVPWARRFSEWWSWRALILAVAAFVLFDDLRWKERFAFTLVAFLAVATLASFGALLLPDPVFIDEPGVILRNHTTQGMALVAGFMLGAMLLARGGWSKPVRAGLLAALLLFVANLALVAGGRSGHLALLAASGVGAFCLVQGRRRWLALAVVPLVALAVLASSGMVRQRFEKAAEEFDTAKTSPVETSMGLRVVIWETTARLISQRPLLGYGVGGLAPAYARDVHEHFTGWQAAEAKDTHNQYLRVCVEAGIPGLLALAAFIAGVARQGAANPYGAAARGIFAAWLATSLFNSHFQTFAESHLVDIILGALLAGGMATGQSPPVRQRPAPA